MINFINIGLDFGDTREWHLDEIIKALYFHNIEFIAIEIQRPEGAEPTAIVTVPPEPLSFSLYMLCKTLRQDCIAVWGSSEPGILIGPKADRWGAFDPKRFLLPKVVEKHIIDKLA